MSIRIEVTGNSLGEVADKLLALAVQMGAEIGCGYDHTPNAETVAAMQELRDKRKTTRKAKKAEPEVAEEAPSPEPVTAVAETASSQNTIATAQPEPSESSETAKNTDAFSASSASAEPTLDFDKDVAPVVIEAVQKAGREGVSSTLAEFGAERASEVDPAQWGELITALKAL